MNECRSPSPSQHLVGPVVHPQLAQCVTGKRQDLHVNMQCTQLSPSWLVATSRALASAVRTASASRVLCKWSSEMPLPSSRTRSEVSAETGFASTCMVSAIWACCALARPGARAVLFLKGFSARLLKDKRGDWAKGVIQLLPVKWRSSSSNTNKSLRVGLSYASKIIAKLVLVAEILTLECHTENGPQSQVDG